MSSSSPDAERQRDTVASSPLDAAPDSAAGDVSRNPPRLADADDLLQFVSESPEDAARESAFAFPAAPESAADDAPFTFVTVPAERAPEPGETQERKDDQFERRRYGRRSRAERWAAAWRQAAGRARRAGVGRWMAVRSTAAPIKRTLRTGADSLGRVSQGSWCAIRTTADRAVASFRRHTRLRRALLVRIRIQAPPPPASRSLVMAAGGVSMGVIAVSLSMLDMPRLATQASPSTSLVEPSPVAVGVPGSCGRSPA
jgi:hypothetical protein